MSDFDRTCTPSRADALVQRVFPEVAAVRHPPLSRNQGMRIRDYLLRELEQSSEDNGYLLNQDPRRYEHGETITSGVVAGGDRKFTGDTISRAASTYRIRHATSASR